MDFVYPNFLWAFFLLLIPIIIHLFNFRRYKTIYFSRVKFLREVVEDSRSGSKLKHLLVLFTRILALTALILAFAQPYIPLIEGEATENVTSLYIDNSFSMQADGMDGTLLNEVKNHAIELVKSFEPNERINLLTSDLTSSEQRFYSKNEIIDKLKEINFSAKTTTLSSVLKLQMDLFNGIEEKGNKRIFLLSDFQKTTTDLNGISPEQVSTFIYGANPVKAENIFIDSVWFESPVHRINKPVELTFRVRNNGTVNQNDIPIKLIVNGQTVSTTRVDVTVNSFIDEKLILTDQETGPKSAVLSLASSQLFFDDEFYFSYDTKEKVEILIIQSTNDKNSNIAQLYNLDSYYNAVVSNIENIRTEMFQNKELIILQNIDKIPSGFKELLNNALVTGATLLLIPGEDIDRTSWNTYLSEHNLPQFGPIDTTTFKLNYFNSADPLYSGVFETKPDNFEHPTVFKSYALQRQGNQKYLTLFGRSESAPFFYYSYENNARIAVMSSPLDVKYTNFQNHALFAASLLRLAETATFQKPLFMTIGKMSNFPIYQEVSEKGVIHLMNEAEKIDIIPQLINSGAARAISFSKLEGNLKRSGFYNLTDKQNFSQTLGLNYDRSESIISSYSTDEVLAEFRKEGWNNIKKIDTNTQGNIEINALQATEYWRILLILTLIFFGIEILLLKFWKS